MTSLNNVYVKKKHFHNLAFLFCDFEFLSVNTLSNCGSLFTCNDVNTKLPDIFLTNFPNIASYLVVIKNGLDVIKSILFSEQEMILIVKYHFLFCIVWFNWFCVWFSSLIK